MRYIKAYENHNKPEIGDYVLCKDTFYTSDNNKKINNFLSTNIGEFVYFLMEAADYNYIIKYENVPKDIEHLFISEYVEIDIPIEFKQNNCFLVSYEEIIKIGKKEDLETYLDQKKYNL